MHSSGEKFICSGENILHHHPTEIAALSEQTSKYSNEHLVRTPNHYIHFFSYQISIFAQGFSGIPGSNGMPGMQEFLAPQGRNNNKEKMELRGRDREA